MPIAVWRRPGQQGGRGLPAPAGQWGAMVLNPPGEMTRTWNLPGSPGLAGLGCAISLPLNHPPAARGSGARDQAPVLFPRLSHLEASTCRLGRLPPSPRFPAALRGERPHRRTCPPASSKKEALGTGGCGARLNCRRGPRCCPLLRLVSRRPDGTSSCILHDRRACSLRLSGRVTSWRLSWALSTAGLAFAA